MKVFVRSVIALVFCLVAVPAFAQTATPNQSLSWEAPSASAEMVTRFEVKYDNGSYTDVGMVPVPGQPNRYYAPLPALITGQHTVVVRGCNAAGCGPDSTPTFTFTMVAGVPTVIQGGTIMIITTP